MLFQCSAEPTPYGTVVLLQCSFEASTGLVQSGQGPYSIPGPRYGLHTTRGRPAPVKDSYYYVRERSQVAKCLRSDMNGIIAMEKKSRNMEAGPYL